MDRYEALNALLEMGKDLLAMEQAAGFVMDDHSYMEEVLRVVDEMLADEEGE